MYTIDGNIEITAEVVCDYISRHQYAIAAYDMLDNYYKGKHRILERTKGRENLANNRIVCNHAKHIVDTAAGYLVGNPVTYKGRGGQNIEALTDWLRLADSSTQDMDLAKDAGIYGSALELVYMSNEISPSPKLTEFDPRQGFVVYDETVEHEPVFGVYYYPLYEITSGMIRGYNCRWITKAEQVDIELDAGMSPKPGIETRTENIFGAVPLIEYDNNEEQQGDFEQVIPLIDAYNLLQSDRVNDKEQFVNAILVLKGNTMGDTFDEASEAYKMMKQYGVLELTQDGIAEWLTRTFSEESVEVLRRSLEQDIHKFSGVPCMSDESFAGNASGVAMRYKLLGFEQIVKIKERYFREGLKKRIRLFCNVLSIKGQPAIDPEQVEISFTRNLPVNELENAQIVSMLQGVVPDEILYNLLPFVEDKAAAALLLQKQKEESIRQQQKAFIAAANTAPDEDAEEVTNDEDAEP